MTVLQFPRPDAMELGEICGGVWTCQCGSQHWVLYENGVCLCAKCNNISAVLKVSHEPVAPQEPPHG